MVYTVDTPYAPDGASYKSITGATTHMASNTGSMLTMSTKQTRCADLSMSTEGIGCHLLVRRVLLLRYFFKEWRFPQQQPTMIFMYNGPFIKLVIGNEGAVLESLHAQCRASA